MRKIPSMERKLFKFESAEDSLSKIYFKFGLMTDFYAIDLLWVHAVYLLVTNHVFD